MLSLPVLLTVFHAFISQEEDSSLVQADDLLCFRADVQAAGCGGVCGVPGGKVHRRVLHSYG